jgi:hypothetical protein
VSIQIQCHPTFPCLSRIYTNIIHSLVALTILPYTGSICRLLPIAFLVLRQSQPPPNIPAYDVALGRLGRFAPVGFECLLQHASVEETI